MGLRGKEVGSGRGDWLGVSAVGWAAAAGFELGPALVPIQAFTKAHALG